MRAVMILALSTLLSGFLSGAVAAGSRTDTVAAELDTRRMIGKGYYENDEYDAAAAAFRRCIELAPDSATDYFNLGLVKMRAQDYEQALAALAAAEARDSTLVGVHYIRGIIYKRQGEFDLAAGSLERVIAEDPACRGAHYNLGVCYKGLQRYEEAILSFKREETLSPGDPSTHYQLISLYRRLGDVENFERHKEIFARVKDTVDESEKTAEALERSRYTYILVAGRLSGDLAPRPAGPVRVTFAAGTGLQSEERDGRAVAIADCDADGDLDVYVVNSFSDPEASTNALFLNQGDGTFVDGTAAAGVADPGMGLDAVFGDYDNDGDLDLYVVNCGANVLYRNRGDGTFEDVSEAAGADEPGCGQVALFVDYDHDNDLDILIGNQSLDSLLRNRGDGTFSDASDEAGLLVSLADTRDAIAADFDGDQDTDLLLLYGDAPPVLFANARLGRFSRGGSFSPPIPAGARAAAEGDFNHDGQPDLVVAVEERLFLYTNNGRGEFTGEPIAVAGTVMRLTTNRIEVVDYNNDGWSDLLIGAPLRLLAGSGAGNFEDHSSAIDLSGGVGSLEVDLATGDLDGDGDEDIVLLTRADGPVFLRSEDTSPRNWLDVRLAGKKVNRGGLGAKVEIAAGGHYQRQTYNEPRAHFGLGDLEVVDLVRVTWPNGVAQNLIQPAINQRLEIEEEVKVSASCGFLYAYDGRRFRLINEILGIGPLGVPMAPGIYHQPDCTELTRIESDALVAVDGFYDLRLTEELRETMYADAISLRVVDHPRALEIIPNEMFSAPPFPEDRLFAVGDHLPPCSAVDDRGNDVLDLVSGRDGRFPTFPLTDYQGLARPHSITLDFGDLSGAETITLFLDSWIYWPESSTVIAIAQDPRFEIMPLSLAVADEQGRWQTVIESVGLPTSKGLVVPVDLTGRFASYDHRIRLSTNLCVYFDRVFVSTHDEAARCRVTELAVAEADLHYRGFSSMSRDAHGFERFDYGEVRATGSWNPPDGLFTRYGDVRGLLASPDNMYVIFGPGDELSLRFDAGALPELPSGWTRDFVFYANGWVKDGDLNTRFSESVTPLPFHGMSGYPYPDSERYPGTPALERYLRSYNTRPSRPTVGRLARQAE